VAREVVLRFTANVRSLQQGMMAAAASVKDFEGQVVQVASTANETQRIAGRAMAGLGVAMAGGLALATRAAIQFEERMRNVATISTDVQKNFGNAGNAILSLSADIGVSANQLAEGLYDVASSGFQGAAGMEVLRASAIAAQAGLSTTAVAARAITGALNAYGLSAASATDVSDIFFQTVNLGIVTFDELAQSVGDYMGTAHALGVALDEASAGFAAITLAGIPAAEASTSLNGVMRQLLQPSDALRGVLEALGYDSGQAMIQALGLGGALQTLRKAVGGNTSAFLELFPEIRAARGALAITANDGENWNRVAGEITDKNARAGAASRALAQQQKSLGAQLKIAKEQITSLAISVGQSLLPVLRPLVGMVRNIAAGFASLGGSAQTGVAAIGVLGGGLLALGGTALLLGPKIATAVKWFQTLQVTAPLLATSLSRLTLALGAIGIALTIGAAVLSAYGARKRETKDATDRFVEALKQEQSGVENATKAMVAKQIVEQDLDRTAMGFGISVSELTNAMLGQEGAVNRVKTVTQAYIDSMKGKPLNEAERAAVLGAQALLAAVTASAAGAGSAADQIARQDSVLKALGITTGQAADETVVLTNEQKKLKDAIDAANNVGTVYTSTLRSMQEADSDAASASKDAMDERHRAEREALQNEKITGSASQAAHDRKMQELEERQAAEKKAAETTAKTTTRTRLSMEEYRKAIEKNTTDTRAWMRNLATISARGGAAFVDELAKLGPEASGLVAEVATSSDKDFERFKSTMVDASSSTTDAVQAQFGLLPEALGTIGLKSGTAMAEKILEGFRAGIVPIADILRLAGEPIPPGPMGGSGGSPGFRTGRSYAEGHVAQIAPAGSWRLWAEPETGGEAYIPLAASKRARSAAILADVAARFGMGLITMAEGGMWAVPASARVGGQVDPALLRTLGRLEQRLSRGGAQIGQVVFNERIDPLHAAAKIAWKVGR
jgi:TP901 family phage tail tape measure protein